MRECKPLQVLIVEDSVDDTLLIMRQLKQGGYAPSHERVETREDMEAALARHEWDLIFSDHSMPDFDSLSALNLLQRTGRDVPFIIISGFIREEDAVAAMKAGARDYLGKDHLARLVPVVERELREAAVRRESRKASEDLCASEAKYRELVENANSIILRMDLNGRVTFFKEFAQTFFGYTEAEILGRSVVGTIVPEEDSAGRDLARLIGDLVRHPERYASNQNENMRKNGQRPWVAWANKPVVDEQGKMVEILCIGNDISERKRAEDALQQSEAELATIYNHAPVIMALLDADRRVRRLNKAAIEFVDRPTEDLLGLRAGEVFGCLHSADDFRGCGFGPSCTTCGLRLAVQETLQTGMSRRRVEARLTLMRGAESRDFVVMASTALLRISEKPMILLCLEDITARKHAEEQVREQAALLDVAQDAITVHDLAGHIIFWNSGATRLYGWTKSEAEGQKLEQLLFAQTPNLTSEAQRLALERQEWSGEFRQRTKDQREVVVQSRWTLVRNEQGAPTSVLAVSTDVTEKKRLQAQLMRAQRLESIGTLASGIAHDLNNVLSPIMMALQYFREKIETKDDQLMLEALEDCTKRGADIIRQVLTFARGPQGTRIVLQPRHLVEEMLRIAQKTFPRLIRIHSEFCSQPWTIQADPTQMQQVLMNLCVNARDAMPDGGHLSILVENLVLAEGQTALHPKSKPGSYVVLKVKDDGAGIPPDSIDKIFDPFYTTKPPGQGTGLGLPTVLGIVEGLGGFIQVESRVGSGSEFQIYIPRAETNESPAEPPSDPQRLQGQGELILVADDEPLVRDLIRRILERAGYRVLLAEEGCRAVSIYRCQGHAIQGVVTDLNMPSMGGQKEIDHLRMVNPDVRILAISGAMSMSNSSDQELPGVQAYLAKPFTAEQLLAAVRQLVME